MEKNSQDFVLSRLEHLKVAYKDEVEFVKHLLSGEVTMPLPQVIKLVSDFHLLKQEEISLLPVVSNAEEFTNLFNSACQVKQVVQVRFIEYQPNITATVIGVHFTASKVKYDLELWLGVIENKEQFTRIYNVDSAFVTPL